MDNTFVTFACVCLFIDFILLILFFHIFVMKNVNTQSKFLSCASNIAFIFVYSVIIMWFIIILKNYMVDIIKLNPELFLVFFFVFLFVIIIFFFDRKSSKSSYTMEQIDKMDGKTFEKACADILKNNGFINVEITGRSGDGGVDIIAYKNQLKYAVQCKRYSHKLGNSSIQEVFSGKAYYNCDKAVVITNNYFTKPAMKYANSLNVELWDRNYLSEII